MKEQPKNDNGVYYFLGNITSHISHVMPLFKTLGGVVVVTSKKAKKSLQNYDIPVINMDNKPYRLMRPGRRPKLIHEHSILDSSLRNTYAFLNNNAKVILFYDLFDIKHPSWLQNPKKVFLHHGNGLKPFFSMQPKRIKLLDNYDFIASLGPNLRKRLLEHGIAETKLVDIGIARTDEAIENQQKVHISNSISDLILSDINTPIVAYVPTFWGATSIYDTGLELVKNISTKYTLLFRPHPQTPDKILRKYASIIKNRKNVYMIGDDSNANINLTDIISASSIIIGDLSSVMLEAILTKKPLVFAYGHDKHRQNDTDYDPIKNVVDRSQRLTPDNVSKINDVLKTATSHRVDDKIWDKTIKDNFYNYSGDSSITIANFIKSLL